MNFEAVIGLEVHAQLLTETKLFEATPNAFGDVANKHVSPVSLGLPGALPVLNRHAVDLAIKAGLALGSKVQPISVWERKNYFYPDLPKGYQISQFEKPICLGGHLDITLDGQTKRINLTRIHMEEDAGKLIHDQSDSHSSLVDLNRAGVPLIEIVSEPELKTPFEAGEYLRQLRSILRYCGVCDGNMEEGSFRCDANVSIKPVGQKELGTKVELKNINSFRFVEKAIEYEIERQKVCISNNEEIIQETRLWNADKNMTESMRSKEYAHDYRYFPDPDLVPLVVDDKWIEKIRVTIPELPQAKTKRYINDFNLSEMDADVLTAEKSIADFFEATLKYATDPKKTANWIMTELMAKLKQSQVSIENCKIKPEFLAQLISLIDKGTISGKIAKKVFQDMFDTGENPEKIVKDKNLIQVSDSSSIEKVIDNIIAENQDQVEQYRLGKEKVFGFFVGQVMKIMKGQANPQMVNDLLKKKLSKES